MAQWPAPLGWSSDDRRFRQIDEATHKEMKALLIDRALLVLTALVLAVAAWATIHYLGESYFSVSTTVLIVVLLAENWRLHKLLREHGIRTRWHKGDDRGNM